MAAMIEYTCLRPPVLNRDILKLPTKTARQMPFDVGKEITHSGEMNNKLFDIHLDVLDNARNVIERI
jgi:hypothetical protein